MISHSSCALCDLDLPRTYLLLYLCIYALFRRTHEELERAKPLEKRGKVSRGECYATLLRFFLPLFEQDKGLLPCGSFLLVSMHLMRSLIR